MVKSNITKQINGLGTDRNTKNELIFLGRKGAQNNCSSKTANKLKKTLLAIFVGNSSLINFMLYSRGFTCDLKITIEKKIKGVGRYLIVRNLK